MKPSEVHYGFTGTQNGLTEAQDSSLVLVMDLLARAAHGQTVYFHHGDCIGADARADEIARALGMTPVVHPPLRHQKRAFVSTEGAIYREPKPYLDRNTDIVDESIILIGTPKDFIMPKDFRGQGTWSTVNKGIKKIQTIVVFPDGRIDWTYSGNSSS